MQGSRTKALIAIGLAIATVAVAEWMFDGTDDLVDLGNDASLALSSNMTLMVRCLPERLNVQWQFLACRGSELYDGNVVWGIRLNGSGDNRFYFYRGNGSTAYSSGGSEVVVTGEWYTVIGMHRGTNLYIYVNGSCENTGSVPAVVESPTNSHAWIADWIKASGTDSGQYFKGRISEVYIWNRALTDQEISMLNDGPEGVGSRLLDECVGCYFEGGNCMVGTNATLVDYSRYGNDGSASGGVQIISSRYPRWGARAISY